MRRSISWLLLTAAACSGSQGAPPRSLQLRHIDPRIKQGVFLNEPLTFHFTADVDPLSVGRESVVIETAAGERARGSLSVEGRKIVFQPDVPHAADLSDGGYRPGTEYVVHLAGFPRPDGIRGVDGAPLAKSERCTITTVGVDAPRRRRLFDDPHQEPRKPPDLFPGGAGNYQLGVGEALYLGSEKQIDPTSVRSGDFKLVRTRAGAGAAQSYELYARLVENEPVALRERPRGIHSLQSDESWRAAPRAALLQLTPVQPLEPDEYVLTYDPPDPPAGEEAWSLRDFSLRELIQRPHPFSRTIEVLSGSDSGARGESIVEDFVDRNLRSPMVVPDCDGTAAWEGTGRVEVHYPLAAGDGSAEAVALGETEARTDLQATSIDLAAPTTCRLSDAPGLVVLRAQGKITLRGNLERRAPFAEVLDCGPEGTSLSAWLARAQMQNPSWTVVIAGGDIVIEGELRSQVPLLLIAGGQVRNSGKSPLPADLVWAQSGAGSLYTPDGPHVARFRLDPPVGKNPLRAPLHYAIVSGPVPATGRVTRWLSAYASGGLEPPRRPQPEPGRTPSSFSVHYLQSDAPQAPDFSKGPTSPVFLPQPGAVRFVIELVVGDEKDWHAPYVDRVQLEYEQRPR